MNIYITQSFTFLRINCCLKVYFVCDGVMDLLVRALEVLGNDQGSIFNIHGTSLPSVNSLPGDLYTHAGNILKQVK